MPLLQGGVTDGRFFCAARHPDVRLHADAAPGGVSGPRDRPRRRRAHACGGDRVRDRGRSRARCNVSEEPPQDVPSVASPGGEHLQPRAPRQRAAHPDRADGLGAVGDLRDHARGRLALRDARDERDRALRRAHVLQGHGAAADGARHRAWRSTRSAASSTPSPARSTPATTSSAPPSRATSRSTCSSTCSATRSSTPTRSSARRA
mgnify:CR=1 FL=1